MKENLLNRLRVSLSDLVRDIAISARTMARTPAVVVVPVFSAALGISACSLIVGIANFALFRPLAVSDSTQLMSITGRNVKTGDTGSVLSYPVYRDLTTARSFEGITAYFPMVPAALSAGHTEARRYWGTIATANYFDIVRPGFLFGRGFDPQTDDKQGAAPAVVLSHHLWSSRFGSDPAIVGRSVVLNGRNVTVVGVTKAGFRGTEVAMVSDFWIPMSMRDVLTPMFPAHKQDLFADRDAHWLFALGRLGPAVTREVAISEAGVIAQRLAASYPASKDQGFHIERAGQLSPAVRRAMVVFFVLLLAVSGLVLLTACANTANLLLARAMARHKEIATRRAIGAGSGRLIRQLLTDSVLLSLTGGALGYLLADWGANNLGRLRLPIALPIDFSVSLDFRVLLFCTALSFLTGIIFGLAPALHAVRQDLVTGLKNGSVQIGSSRRWNLRNALVISQVAICTLLLACAGLFVRSLSSSRSADTGMANRNIALIAFDPFLDRNNGNRDRLLADVLRRVDEIPGVQSAALTTTVPLSLGGISGSLTPDDKVGKKEAALTSDVYEVSSRFFDTLGIRFIAGEDFRPGTDTDDIVILNRAAAEKLFPGQNPIGRRVQIDDTRLSRVVGVVATAKSRTVNEDPRPCMYRPLLRSGEARSITGVTLLLRTRGNPAPYISRASAAVRDADRTLALFDIRTMEEHLHDALLLPRVGAFLLGLAGLIGLTLAALGLYGVISFIVARQTKEMGIRIAIGASRGQIISGVLRRGLGLTAVGTAAGLALALLMSRSIANLLYGVSPTDALTFGGVALFLLMTALAACAVPALRASSVPPSVCIRCE